ncbi:MAG TPA: hypothetical protein VMZ31_02530 [Phycisphaerae bacterium]|nr:hypothetical protein [Phycisphaerae bacterium]
MRSAKWVVTVSMAIALLLSTGCLRAVKYEYAGKKYVTRAEADAAQRKVLDNALATCRTADSKASARCVAVMPTRSWTEQNYLKTTGFGPNEDLKDYVLGTLERSIETQYRMIEKSKCFAEYKIVYATLGNGVDEQLASPESFEIRAVRRESDGARMYVLIAPGGARSRVFGTVDVDHLATFGWGWFQDLIAELGEGDS